MTKRMRKYETWDHIERVLANAVEVEEGEMACLDTSTGEATKGGTSTTLLPIGYFRKSMTGDGTAKARIDLFEPIEIHWFDNDDAPNAVADADVGSEVYVKDDRTVSASSASSTRSKAGRVWAVSSTQGVALQMGSAITGPTGASGSALASGGVATRTALKGVAAASRFDGMLVMVRSDGSLWRFVAASTADADGADELVLVPSAGSGRWLRADKSFVMKLPIAFGLSDGATLLTVPAGMALKLTGFPFWEVTTGFTGGTSSGIGIASGKTGYNTAGDLLGGGSGELTAVLGTAGIKPGTIGPKLDTEAERQAFVLDAAETLTYEEITDAYTAGAGFACFPVAVMTKA